ncbi:unnamed protein product [Musa hybrid cultivar]
MNDDISCVPPGFRFHPTDEELVGYYLRKKVAARKIDLDVIKDVDLYKIEPWDLEEICKIGAEEQTEWHFFSHKDKKYPTGTRTNRATAAGFWKATGRDKPIYSVRRLIGMRKTLVYYKGRAPNGQNPTPLLLLSLDLNQQRQCNNKLMIISYPLTSYYRKRVGWCVGRSRNECLLQEKRVMNCCHGTMNKLPSCKTSTPQRGLLFRRQT